MPEIDSCDRALSRRGDLWHLGLHRLACGDATDPATVARVLAGETPHLMVTDPPYGVGYDPAWREKLTDLLGRTKGVGALGRVANDDTADWRRAWALFPGDVAYVWHSSLHGDQVRASLEACRFAIRSQIIWDKGRLIISRGHYHWRHEPCWYAVRKGRTARWTGDRRQMTVWQIPHRRSETGHGTQKPLLAMMRPIENHSRVGDAVYDPFVGSGTTIVAAETSGRRCLAIEIDPGYVDVAVRRWEAMTGLRATRAEQGDGGAAGERGRGAPSRGCALMQPAERPVRGGVGGRAAPGAETLPQEGDGRVRPREGDQPPS